MARFAKRVALYTKNGMPEWFNPGDTVPDWAWKQLEGQEERLLAPEDVPPEPEQELEDMTVAQLVAMAKDRGIELPSNKKTEIIEAIRSFAPQDPDHLQVETE